MDEKIPSGESQDKRCESCGMPLGTGFYGTNSDGTANSEYCKLCFEKGEFREPNLKVEDMIARSIASMIDDLHMEPAAAETLADSVIPNLKRWKMQS